MPPNAGSPEISSEAARQVLLRHPHSVRPRRRRAVPMRGYQPHTPLIHAPNACSQLIPQHKSPIHTPNARSQLTLPCTPQLTHPIYTPSSHSPYAPTPTHNSHSQCTPPTHTPNSHSQCTPPSHAPNAHPQSAPPIRTLNSHPQLTPPIHTPNSHSQYTPTHTPIAHP